MQVLIVGAGPTGLVLALWLTRLGVKVRIIDKTKEAGTTSRALVVHARTFEFYQQIGIAEEVLSRGLKFTTLNLWIKGRRVARVEMGEIGKGLSPFPYLVIFPQDEHERLLIEHLRAAGVEVERETELISLAQKSDGVDVTIKAPGGLETSRVQYLAGCDGAHSTVRSAVGASFAGTTYSHIFYVADVEAEGLIANQEFHGALDTADLLFAFPLKGKGRVRLIGTVRETGEKHDFTWEDVSGAMIKGLGINVKKVHWFSTYHVHHRVADHFQFGRVFLLGDAGHIHSPVGGQGMNTGIGDAVNLAWKIAAVLQGRAGADILKTYETERIAFARRLVATTDRAFTIVTSTTAFARFVRLQVIPRILPKIFRSKLIRRFMFRTVSQIAIEYRQSALSEGCAGRLCGGDRLPWTGENFAPLSSLQWQVHVYGEAVAEVASVCKTLGLALHRFEWNAAFEREMIYLIRPDGYIAFVGSSDGLLLYVEKHGLRTLK